MLRRQAIRPLRKPLIVMSPKSLLRKKEAVSTLEEMADGKFQTVIQDTSDLEPKKVKKVILCSGKVYYDLEAYRAENGIEDRAILRLNSSIRSRRMIWLRRSHLTSTWKRWFGVKRSQ